MQVRNHPNGKSGAALFLVLIIISSLSVFGGVLLLMSHNRLLMCQLEEDRIKALFLAEAGIADAVFELKSALDADNNGIGNISEKPLGDGTYSVIHNPVTGEIRSEGVVNAVPRTVQIKYAVN